MSTAFYERIAATAVRLLKSKGQPITLIRAGDAGGYDPETGTTTAGTNGMYTGVGVPLPYAQGVIDGTLIQQSDTRILLDPNLPVEPKNGDLITISRKGVAHVLRVVNNKPIAPTDRVVLHDVQARGS